MHLVNGETALGDNLLGDAFPRALPEVLARGGHRLAIAFGQCVFIAKDHQLDGAVQQELELTA
ncbi:MAG: hypothetical protein ACR2NN_07180 [Bryobacteraceae bacterium]